MADPNRVPLTIRLRPDDKERFVEAAEQSGLEAGIAARTVIELLVKRLREGRTFFQAVGDIERALLSNGTLSDEKIERRIAEAERRLNEFAPRDVHAEMLARIEGLEAERQRRSG